MSICNLTDEYTQTIYRWVAKGAHSSETQIRSNLGTAMKRLYTLSLGDVKLDDYLDIIRRERGSDLSLEQWREQYGTYLLLLAQRQNYINLYNKTKSWYQNVLEDVPNLTESNWNMWGSVTQLKFGRVVIDGLNIKLDPVFGALLSPTGGIVGPGNTELYKPNRIDCVVMHGVFHDAGGYLYNYHNIGPGYNYIHTRWTMFPTSSPLCNQVSGISWWVEFIERYKSNDDELCKIVSDNDDG